MPPRGQETVQVQRASVQELARTQCNLPVQLIKYEIYMKEDGRRPTTITTTMSRLALLSKYCNINNPTEVKTLLSKLDWQNSTKNVTVGQYTSYLKFIEQTWKPPTYLRQEKVIFIPTEIEVDQLIAAASKNLAPVLQFLKDTAARIGEAIEVQWTDIDLEKKLVSINHPEKGSLPRIVPFTEKCKQMIAMLPRTDKPIFLSNATAHGLRTSLEALRERLTKKLQNPRFLKIHFHTFRHYKATNAMIELGDSFYVRDLLGHKTSTMTDRYMKQARTQTYDNGQYVSLVTKNIEEEQRAIEKGYTLIRSINETTALYRKRK